MPTGHGAMRICAPAEAQKDTPSAPEFGKAALERGGEWYQPSEASFCVPSLRNREGLPELDDEAQRKIPQTSCTRLLRGLLFFESNAAMGRGYDAKMHQSET